LSKSRAMVFRHIVASLAMALTFLLPANGFATAGDAAATRVDSLYTTLLNTMKQAKQLGIKGRYDKLAPVLGSTYDLALMSKIAVGQNWNALSAAEQQSIVTAFARMTTATYASRFDDFAGEQFEVLQTADQPNGDKIVKTRIVQSDRTAVQLNYLMRNTGNGWKIIDVYLNGTISDLATRRDEFASIIASGGADGLIKRLHDRTQKLLGG